MNDLDLFRTLVDLGISAVLLAALLSGSRGLWVYGRTHEAIVRMYETRITEITRTFEARVLEISRTFERRVTEIVDERDQWRRMALKGTDVAEKAVDAMSTKRGP